MHPNALRQFLAYISFIFLFSQTAWGQKNEIKALKQKLNAMISNDTAKVKLLNDLSYSYYNVNSDSMLAYARKALELSRLLNNSLQIANSYRNLGIGSYLRGEHNNALYYSRKALAIYKGLNEKFGEANTCNNIAIFYHNVGKYDLALRYYNFSFALRKQLNDVRGIADSYNNIGNTYTDQGNYLDALKMHYEGLKIRESIIDSIGMANSYLNIAGVYFYLKNADQTYLYAKKAYDIQVVLGYTEDIVYALIAMGGSSSKRNQHLIAINYFKKAIKISVEANYADGEAIALSNLGEEYLSLNKPELAINCYSKAFLTSKQLNDINGITICEIGLGKSYLQQNKFKEGVFQLTKGYELAKSYNSKIHILEAAEALSKAYQKQKNHEKSIEFLNVFLAYKDSIFGEETNVKIQEMNFNFQLANKEKEITSLEKDKAIQQQKHDFQQLILSAMAFVILLLLLFLFILNKYRIIEQKAKSKIISQKFEIENQASKLEDLNIFKDKTLSIISHDLRGPIYTLSQFIEMMEDNLLTEEDFALAQNNFKNQLIAIGLLLDNTLNWAKNEMASNQENIQSKTNIALLIERNFKLFKKNVIEKNISLELIGDLNLLAWANPDHMDIILRNLINNAIKFSGNNGKISLSISQENTLVVIQIIDNGIGMSKEILANLFSYKTKQGNYGTKGERGAGIGLILTKEFVERNQGTIVVLSQEGIGTTITLHFPMA